MTDTPREVLDRAISEEAFTRSVIALAQLCGWRVHRNWTELHSPKGWPDLVCCREEKGVGRLVFIEAKSARGKLSPKQAEWLSLLGRVPGVMALCIRPQDWDEVVALLQRSQA